MLLDRDASEEKFKSLEHSPSCRQTYVHRLPIELFVRDTNSHAVDFLAASLECEVFYEREEESQADKTVRSIIYWISLRIFRSSSRMMRDNLLISQWRNFNSLLVSRHRSLKTFRMALCLEQNSLSKTEFISSMTLLLARRGLQLAYFGEMMFQLPNILRFLFDGRLIHIFSVHQGIQFAFEGTTSTRNEMHTCSIQLNIITLEHLVDFPLDRVDVGQRRQSRMIRSNGWMSGFDEQAFLSGSCRMNDSVVHGNERTRMWCMVHRAVHYYSISNWMEQISLR